MMDRLKISVGVICVGISLISSATGTSGLGVEGVSGLGVEFEDHHPPQPTDGQLIGGFDTTTVLVTVLLILPAGSV